MHRLNKLKLALVFYCVGFYGGKMFLTQSYLKLQTRVTVDGAELMATLPDSAGFQGSQLFFLGSLCVSNLYHGTALLS